MPAFILILLLSFSASLFANQKKTKIASLALVTDEILVDLKLPADKYEIVLLSHFSKNKLYSNITPKNIQTFHGNPEEIEKAKPDIIFYTSFNKPSVKNHIEHRKTKSVMLKDFHSIESIKQNTQMIINALGYKADSKIIKNIFQTEPCTLKQNTSALPYSKNLIFTGKKSLVYELLKKINISYAPAKKILGSYGKITEEQLIEFKPDFLLLNEQEKVSSTGPWHHILKSSPKMIRVPNKILSSVNLYLSWLFL